MNYKELMFAFGVSFFSLIDNIEACQASGCYPKNEIMVKYEEEQINKIQRIKNELLKADSDEKVKRLSTVVNGTVLDFENQMKTDSISAGYIGLPYLFDELYGIQLVLDWKLKTNNMPKPNSEVYRVLIHNKNIFKALFPNL